jgi:hypothetical protein
MTEPALNPVAPSRALARNAPSRKFAQKQLESYSALTSEKPLADITPHRIASPKASRAREKAPSEQGSPIQIP